MQERETITEAEAMARLSYDNPRSFRKWFQRNQQDPTRPRIERVPGRKGLYFRASFEAALRCRRGHDADVRRAAVSQALGSLLLPRRRSA